MSRIAAAALIAALAAGAPLAASASDQLRTLVEQRLPAWGYVGVDVDTLTIAQVANIYSVMNGPKSHSDKALLIEGILRGGFVFPRGPSAI